MYFIVVQMIGIVIVFIRAVVVHCVVCLVELPAAVGHVWGAFQIREAHGAIGGIRRWWLDTRYIFDAFKGCMHHYDNLQPEVRDTALSASDIRILNTPGKLEFRFRAKSCSIHPRPLDHP